jgi:hypothetical protein
MKLGINPRMTNDQIIAACAQAAHEMNRIYCEANGDPSQPGWAGAEEWQRDFSIKGATQALAGDTPEKQHEQWSADKLAAGWKLGPVKDPGKKEHPCLVPYGELPPWQQRKDSLYIATVRAMASALGWEPGG